MFFPRSPNLPTVGDVVCFRYCHEPYTVGMVSPCNTLYHLIGLDAPVRVETLAWYPQVGDVVEVLFAPYLKHLNNRLEHHNARWHRATDDDKPDIYRVVEAVKLAMRKAINYRTGELMRVENTLAQVGFPSGSEVLPFHCIATTSRQITPRQNHAEARQPQTRTHPCPQASVDTQQPISAAAQPSRELALARTR